MATLVIEIEESLLLHVLNESQEQEISLNRFICEALSSSLANPTPIPSRKVVNVEELISKAVAEVEAIEVGTEFMLVDLCADEDWEALSGGERKSLGKGFRKAVEGMSSPIATYVRRTSSNKAVYQRV